jgi:cathepsin A (carboxypeptidase C)
LNNNSSQGKTKGFQTLSFLSSHRKRLSRNQKFLFLLMMKLLSSALLITAVAAAAAPSPQQQQVLKDATAGPQAAAADHGAWLEQLQKLAESVRTMVDSGDAGTVLHEIKARFPQLEQMAAPPPRGPKPHTRRPDHYWDSITRGVDLQSVWVENADGEKEREIDGKLEPYTLRSRAVDPSKLGVDPGVKQYSGYLDDDENDKHLFYCKSQS